MTSLYENEMNSEPVEVIRLKVDGSSSAVNTLRDQLTSRGLSLICPFPALEVEIPVKFACGREEPRNQGTIHRIGVEDDPETGLPRLRLSVRAHNTRATIVAPPDELLLDESSRMTAAPEPDANTDLNVVSVSDDMRPFIGDLLGGEPVEMLPGLVPDGLEDTEKDFLPMRGRPDPAWVGCGELPLPDKIGSRSKTRRRRQYTGVASWLVVLGIAVGGVYMLDRAKVVDIDDIKQQIAGFAMDAEEPSVAPEILTGEISPPAIRVDDPAAIATPVEPEQMPEPDNNFEIETLSEPIDEPIFEEVAVLPGGIELASSSAQPPMEEIESEPELADPVAEEKIEPTGEEASSQDVTVVLPTRWPAEYANAYRLRSPNGIVVDVPGGLVKKEGWLDVGRDHTMIRSIKAVQRETGARFVVFVNGELPRFMTAPKTGGISLRLYREDDTGAGETEQVAVLDR